MNPSNKLLSDIVSVRTYSKYLEQFQRREIFEETVNRTMSMHLDKFPKLSKEIVKAFSMVHQFKVMPSMRYLQFSGAPILRNNLRGYNCSFLNIKDPRDFAEILFLLLSGTGVGFSVQKHHIKYLPKVKKPIEEGVFTIQDSIAGWAQSIHVLMDAYFNASVRPVFDFGHIRPKGALLYTTGAKAPGPEPLKYMLGVVEDRLKKSIGKNLTSLEIHDIICIISDCVLSGGIRRSSLISLFDRDDLEMLKAKTGKWYEEHPYRARANNSAVLPRKEVTKDEFLSIFDICKKSGSGEPGFSWTNNIDMGFNPCFSGETLITTKIGTFQIKDLINKTVDIWNGTDWQSINNFRITGENQKILKINLQDGSFVRLTPSHTCILDNGTRLKAKDLKIGDRLKISMIENHGTKKTSGAYLKGFIVGDGTHVKDRALLFLYSPKYVCEERLKRSAEEIRNEKLNTNAVETVSFRNDFDNNRKIMLGLAPKKSELIGWSTDYKNGLPPEVFSWDKDTKCDFLAGLFDSDGCASITANGFMYQISSISLNLLLNIQSLLKTMKIRSKVINHMQPRIFNKNDGYGDYLCKESFRLTISQEGAIELSKNVKFERLKSFADKTVVYNLRPRYNKIIDIVEDGMESKVYCCTVNGSNSLSLNVGIQFGQCHEISLNSNQLCNLSIVNQTGVTSKKDYLSRIYSATFLGTLQAAYTDFPYLDEKWSKITEKEALLGVSFTGIADMNSMVDNDWLQEGAELVLQVNEKYARKIGINLAARTTTGKPEGTSSCVLGSSSGIHSRKGKYYLRRVQINKDDALYSYLMNMIPDLIENAFGVPNTAVITIPQESPEGAITEETETSIQLFNRVIDYNKNWIFPGHRNGDNKHNISCTLSVSEDEWDKVSQLMWKERDNYTGISLFPKNDSVYKQAPFEVCTKEKFDELNKLIPELDLTKVREFENLTSLIESVACGGGACEITGV